MEHWLAPLLLAPFVLTSCAQQGMLRDLAADVRVSYSPRADGTTVIGTLTVRPAPPPIALRDETHGEPSAPTTSLERCRSTEALCRFEQASIERALAIFTVGAP